MDDNETLVPDDFPRTAIASAVPGYQDKWVMTEHAGKYYVPGNAPPERHQQWLECNELVTGYVVKCRNAQAGKYSHMPIEEILTGYYRAAVDAHRDLDTKQLQWVFQQVSEKLGWGKLEHHD